MYFHYFSPQASSSFRTLLDCVCVRFGHVTCLENFARSARLLASSCFTTTLFEAVDYWWWSLHVGHLTYARSPGVRECLHRAGAIAVAKLRPELGSRVWGLGCRA